MTKRVMYLLLLFLIVPSITCPMIFYAQTIALPSIRQSWTYAPVALPVLGDDHLQVKPVSLGPLATGGDTLSIRIGLNQFAAPVDIYGAYRVSTNPGQVKVLRPNGTSFNAFTVTQILNALSTGVRPQGAEPWKSGVTGPIDEQLFNIATANLPPGSYTAYLLVTPANDLSNYYLWVTRFNIGVGFCVHDFVGNWQGQWVNNTFSTQGNVSMTVVLNGQTNQEAAYLIDIDGNVFGIDPAPLSGTAPLYCTPFSTDMINIIGGGDNSYTFDNAGNVTGSTTNIPFPGIDSVDVTGTINRQNILLNYTVNFTFDASAQGVVTLNKQ
ncbi:hypothetical protein EP227_02660 [bacterium]|nr:MAG: hypothetical protein EP227_02660 [bacterium]